MRPSNLLLACLLLFGAVHVEAASFRDTLGGPPCIGGEKTWDGDGASNNWSEAANWTCDAVPLSSDIVIFNGTTSKDATIDLSVSLSSVQINSGYSGTISQGVSALTVNGSYSQATGTFAGGSGPIIFNTVNLSGGSLDCGTGLMRFNGGNVTQTGGTFNCQNATIDSTPSSGVALNGGVFNAPSGTATFNGGVFQRGAGGTFNPNNGTVIFGGNSISVQIVSGVTTTQDFANLTINTVGGVFGSENDTLRVLGTLNLVVGSLHSIIAEAQGPVSVQSTWGIGSNAVGEGVLLFSGAATRVINLPVLPNFYNAIQINAPNTTVNLSGAGEVKLSSINMIAGTLNGGSTNLRLNRDTRSSTQSGGIVECGSGTLTFDSGNFTQVGGSFNCQNATIISGLSIFAVNGGTFNAPTGSMNFNTGTFQRGAGGTFNHNNGTVIIGGNSITIQIVPGVTATQDFGNLTINSVGGIFGSENDTLRVLGTLNLVVGSLHSIIAEAQGPVSVQSTWGIGSDAIGEGVLLFSGAATRVINLPVLPNFYNAVQINAPNTTVNLTGAGEVKLTSINMIDGTIAGGNTNLRLNRQTRSSTQSGGTVDCGSGTLIFDSGNFTQIGGVFNCQNATINSGLSVFAINGGSFNAPTGTMTFNGGNFQRGAGGNFIHNNGTVVFAGPAMQVNIVNGVAGTQDFGNLTVNTPNNLDGADNDTLRIQGVLSLTGQARSINLEAQGDVVVPNYSGGNTGATLSFTGSNNQTYSNAGSGNPLGTWSINKTVGTVTAATSVILATDQVLNIASGTLLLNNNSNLTSGPLNIGANGKLVNESATTITLGGNLSNSGVVDLQGGGAACPQSDSILIRSSNATQRSWNTVGLGRYRLVDVDVQRMGGSGTKTVFSGTDSIPGSNSASWVFNPACPVELSLTPSSAGVQTGATQSFTAGGGIAPYAFSLAVNNSGASINTSSGLYTAGTTAGANDTVRVTDNFGSTADASVSTFAAANRLAFTVQPSNGVAGQAISPAIQVTVRDTFGNLVSNSNAAVTLDIANNPGSPFGNLSGTLTRNAVAGIATFNDVSIERAAVGYTLLAVSGSLTAATSSGFNIGPAAPSQMRFTVEPTDTNVNQIIMPAVQISILDPFENLVTTATNPITIEAEIVGPVPVAGTTTRNAIGGIATFNDLSISTVSSVSGVPVFCELIALSPGLPSQRSNNPGFNVIGPSRLAFAVQPTNTQAGAAITPAVQVEIQDQFGLFLPNATNAITISGDAFHDLTGTLTRNAINGIATFDDLGLSFNSSVQLTQLVAAAPTLQTAGSATFSILSPLAVTNTNDSGGGSLRQTILNANALAGDPAITFAIPGLGPHQIDLSSALPTITTPMIIDATQDGPGIVLNGISAGAATDGLRIDAPNVRIKGFVIQRFGGNGINLLANARLTTIQGNYIGTNASGDVAQPNAGAGILIGIGATDNDIGGTGIGQGNVLSGNNTGIKIMSGNNRVEGNFIGTNAAGNAAIPNVRGISISGASNNIIGSGNFGSRNIISGNTLGAITMFSGASSSQIVDNHIGTDVSGLNPLANGSGITMGEGSGNEVALNVIAHNGGSAVTIASGIENSIIGNSIHSNSGLGIDLLPAGVTLNDTGDADLGANNLLNYPVLASATSSGGNTIVRGSLNSLASQSFILDFYSSASCDSSGFGEGETHIGATSVSTDANGIAAFTATVNSATAIGRFITATTSNPTSGSVSTSEFSKCQSVATATFEISGRVTNAIGNGLSGVAVKNMTTGIVVISRADGGYTFTNVPGGLTHVIRPSLANTTFAPVSRTFVNLSSDQGNQNFVGTIVRSRISGQVMSAIGASTFALAGATVSLSGGASGATTTDVNGRYAFDNLLPGNYSVTPTKPNFTFAPPTSNLVIGGNQSANFVGSITPFLDGRVIFDSALKVFSMNADGSAKTPIVAIAGAYCDTPSLSRNGRKIVFSCLSPGTLFVGATNTLYSANSDGSGRTALVSNGSSGLRDTSPVWSPDGAKIAVIRKVLAGFSSVFSLRTMNADGSGLTTVFSAPRGDELQSPSWSADGSKIVFARKFGGPGVTQIFSVPALGGSPVQLTLDNAQSNYGPAFSPDGSRIVFRRSGSSSIPGTAFVMNADGSGQTAIAAGSSFSSLAWSPDGFRLGFVKQISGLNYGVMDATGNNPVSFTDSVAHPSWASEPAFQTPTGSNVNVTFGATSITFNSVGAAGTTSITPIPPGSAGTVPGGFTVGSFGAYEISTTAAITSPITVCLTVPASVLQTPFNQLSILHNEGGILVNRTSSRNFAIRQVCGVVTSLSPFVVGEEVDVNLPQIAGLLLDPFGTPIVGVTVRLTGAENRTATSDSDGAFRFVNLTAGGNYNIQARQLGYLFNETSQDFVNLSGEQAVVFEGATNAFEISGQVVDGLGAGIPGVSIELDGASQGETTTDVNGNYTFADLPADGLYTLTPSNGLNTFGPNQATVDPLTSDAGDVNFTILAAVPVDILFSDGFE